MLRLDLQYKSLSQGQVALLLIIALSCLGIIKSDNGNYTICIDEYIMHFSAVPQCGLLEPLVLLSLNLSRLRGHSRLEFQVLLRHQGGGWGQKMEILDDLQYCTSSKIWVGGPKKVKNMMT